MGAAASSVDLTPEQRALITSDVEEKYKIMTTEESKSHEVAVEELTKIYGTKTPVVVNGTVVPPPVTESPAPSVGPPVNQSPMTPSRVASKGVPSILAEGKAPSAKGGSLMQSLRSHVDNDHKDVDLKVVDEKTNAVVDNEAPDFSQPRVARAVTLDTSSLKNNVSGMLEDQDKVAKFLEELKGGRVDTSQSSDFRVRRLTYAQKTKENPEKPLPLTNKRTTVYASSEIGVKITSAPFGDDVLGTFSCHGIEPAPYIPPGPDDDVDEEEDEPVGVDKTNQDRGCVVYPFNTQHKDALFMVLDGHGEQGDRVSEFAMRSVVNQLEMNINMNLSVEEALSNAFIHANTSLMTTPIKYMTSGTTCVAMYARGEEFWIANCGDSRVVMARCAPEDVGKDTPIEDLDIKAVDLSRDHKPDDPEEQKRIEEWGGFVKPAPEEGLSARVYLDQKFTMIGLAMARSIGDYAVKAVGVIPTPEVTKYTFQSEDKFTILASDGVWEFISSQEAVDIVKANLHKGCTAACQELIQTAAVRWAEEEGDYRDDVSFSSFDTSFFRLFIVYSGT
jgi:protein phosphatase 2C family protein 2/3